MAADTPKLDTPRLRVTLANGAEHDIQTINADMVNFDLERSKRKWPALTDAPILWISYLAFSALRRDGVIPAGVQFDTWVQTTAQIRNLNEDGQESEETVKAFPTLAAVAPD